MNKFIAWVGMCSLSVTAVVQAAGLALSQIGTADSVGSAGVEGVTNNQDSAAVITNSAGITGVKGLVYQVGLEYLDINQKYEEQNSGLSLSASSEMLIPHLSMASQIDERWYYGFALYAPGGLALSYSDGLIGAGVIDSSEITVVNLDGAIAYKVSEDFSFGITGIAQYAKMKFTLSAGDESSDHDTNVSFALGAQYQVLDNVLMGLTYNASVHHDLSKLPDSVLEHDLVWPAMTALGVDYQVNRALTLNASLNWEQWSEFGDSFDRNYDDTLGGGVSASYQFTGWRLFGGVHYDQSPIDGAENRTIDMPLDETLRIGLGAEWKLESDKLIGVAYQYMDLGHGDTDWLTQQYRFSTNNIHYLTVSFKG
ncbi:outer membrane protein transport protein [uncultured Shewanella sp.]|uniref:OmpP1/FadL family transporter n=1 Tax=uncultured Shewanella sp. TaxID=173975 RepID=UPI002628DFF2|nr:outer membrane protein transport protein [uncultured Shewanella sp.]